MHRCSLGGLQAAFALGFIALWFLSGIPAPPPPSRPAPASLEVYDVQDLTYPLHDFGDCWHAGPCVSEEEASTSFSTSELEGLVSRLIFPTARGRDGRSLQGHQGLLIVRATEEEHAAVGRFLDRLRAEQARRAIDR